jgi:hypothetical protein
MDGIDYFLRPHRVEGLLADKHVTSIAAGSHYCYAIVEDVNEVYSWGMGYNYVLGTREEDNVHEPVKVHPMQFHNNQVKQVGAGDNHVVVLTTASTNADSALPQFEVDFATATGIKEEPEETKEPAVTEPEVKEAQVVQPVATLQVEAEPEAKSAGSKRSIKSKTSQVSKKRLLSQDSKQS